VRDRRAGRRPAGSQTEAGEPAVGRQHVYLSVQTDRLCRQTDRQTDRMNEVRDRKAGRRPASSQTEAGEPAVGRQHATDGRTAVAPDAVTAKVEHCDWRSGGDAQQLRQDPAAVVPNLTTGTWTISRQAAPDICTAVSVGRQMSAAAASRTRRLSCCMLWGPRRLRKVPRPAWPQPPARLVVAQVEAGDRRAVQEAGGQQAQHGIVDAAADEAEVPDGQPPQQRSAERRRVGHQHADD
jgi:hypothetical protein